MEQVLLSVVVCTFNRAELLEQCIISLISQTMDQKSYEIVIVDNNSTDATQEVIAKYVLQHSNIRVIIEPSQGLSYARNRGWKEARGTYVAYIDDDAKAFPDWCEQILAFALRRPEINAFGGPFYPFSIGPFPEWLPKDFGTFDLGPKERELTVGKEWINGSNMIFRRQLNLEGYSFDNTLGMSGSSISYGEETKLLLELANRGIPVYYVPSIKVFHLVAKYKMSLKWLLKSSYYNGKTTNYTYGKNRPFWKICLGVIKQGILGIIAFLKWRNEPFKCRIYYSLRYLASEIGALWGRLSK